MTDEKILSLLNSFKYSDFLDYSIFEALIDGVSENIRAKVNKSNNKVSLEKAAMSIIKEAIAAGTKIDGAYIGKDGKQYVSSHVRGMKINTPIELPDSNRIAEISGFLCQMEYSISCGRCVKLQVPTMKEIKTQIKLLKDKRYKGISYCFGHGLPAVNAAFLLDALTGLGENVECYYEAMKGTFSPILIKNDIGTVFILPINQKEFPFKKGFNKY